MSFPHRLADAFSAMFWYSKGVLQVGYWTMCGLYTAVHPMLPEERATGIERALPITLGDRVWLGGQVVVLPGVTIGEGAVIGAGSVVTRDIPPHVVAVGNPCRVLRPITEQDRVLLEK